MTSERLFGARGRTGGTRRLLSKLAPLLVPASFVLVLASTAAEEPSPPSTPVATTRGDRVQAAYASYKERLDRLFADLSSRLKLEAPDLHARIQSEAPTTAASGYQVIPKLIPEPGRPASPRRAAISAYSWPKTESMIERELAKLGPLEQDLSMAARLPSPGRRTVYERLAAAYPPLPRTQHLIEANIQYNQLWQPSIAANRGIYDRQTTLENAVLERQAIRDALAARDDASFRAAVARVPAATPPLDLSRPRGELDIDLRRREDALSLSIHAATDEIAPLSFLRVEHPSAHRWIVHVPFVTDISDSAFLRAFRQAVETTWRVTDGGDLYQVALSFRRISPARLYESATAAPPKAGGAVDLIRHVALFPPGAAVLTTGAVTTHVTYARCIVIGPNDLAPHDLAHEFGHILGFKDVYFRGYKDLGDDGFEIQEVVAETDDIMGGLGPVRRGQFERLIEAIMAQQRPRSSDPSAR